MVKKMKVIFGTTNKRKIRDLLDIIKNNQLDLEVLTLEDIGWDLGEIEETGKTIEENSLIKAQAIHQFCIAHQIQYPVIIDDSGLFVRALNNEPGVYTARYADQERKENPELPKYECVNKLLRKLNNQNDRFAYYRAVVTCMYENGSYFQEEGISYGFINDKIVEPIEKPYFYTVFVLDSYAKTFNQLSYEERKDTYRYQALQRVLKLIR